MKRIKQTIGPVISTREEMEGLVRTVALMQIDREQLTRRMEKEQLAIQEKYEAQIASITEDIERLLPVARDWCERNEPAFGKKKSLDFLSGVVGWRTGTPALKTLRGWTWAKVLQAFREHSFFRAFIRTKEEVDKEAVLARRENLEPHDLAIVGVRVEQAETFFIEPKIEAFPERLKEAA